MAKFKAGDRVVSVSDSSIDIDIGDAFTITSVDGEFIEFDDRGGEERIRRADQYKLADTPLAVEAGKRYRTRDGRIVGPMVASGGRYDAEYPFSVQHDVASSLGKAWRADGTFSPTRNTEHAADIVAEFTGFKVGDRVRVASDKYGKDQVGNVGTVKTTGHCGWGTTLDVVVEFDDVQPDGRKPHAPANAYEQGHLEYFDGHPPSAWAVTFGVGDWVKDRDGDIGIVVHDDGSVEARFRVAFVGELKDDDNDAAWYNHDELQLVAPGTVKATPADNDNFEPGDIIEILPGGLFPGVVKPGALGGIIRRDGAGYHVRVQTCDGPLEVYAFTTEIKLAA